jgi:uncharacterized protein
MRKNIVIDTNTVLSAMLFKDSIVGRALHKANANFQIVLSEKVWAEFQNTCSRSKFDKYLDEFDRLLFITALKQNAIFIEPTEIITDCRDSKDNKFLELAVAANAPFIITGDEDLLVLNPYRGISILKSGAFLDLELDEY